MSKSKPHYSDGDSRDSDSSDPMALTFLCTDDDEDNDVRNGLVEVDVVEEYDGPNNTPSAYGRSYSESDSEDIDSSSSSSSTGSTNVDTDSSGWPPLWNSDSSSSSSRGINENTDDSWPHIWDSLSDSDDARPNTWKHYGCTVPRPSGDASDGTPTCNIEFTLFGCVSFKLSAPAPVAYMGYVTSLLLAFAYLHK